MINSLEFLFCHAILLNKCITISFINLQKSTIFVISAYIFVCWKCWLKCLAVMLEFD